MAQSNPFLRIHMEGHPDDILGLIQKYSDTLRDTGSAAGNMDSKSKVPTPRLRPTPPTGAPSTPKDLTPNATESEKNQAKATLREGLSAPKATNRGVDEEFPHMNENNPNPDVTNFNATQRGRFNI